MIYLILPLFIFMKSGCYLLSLSRGRVTNYWRSRKTYFSGQKTALRLRKRFLLSFNWFFLLTLFVVLCCNCIKNWIITGLIVLFDKNVLGVCSCYLIAFITLKLIVFENICLFLNCCFFVLILSNYNRALLWSGHICFLMKHILKLFKNDHKVLDVIIVCCYCCLVFLFVLTCFLNNRWPH